MATSYKRVREERGPEAAPILKGSDLNKNEHTVKVKVKGVREAPKNFKSPIILDIAENHEKTAWCPNWTSLKNLEKQYGDDLDNLVGKTLPLNKVLANNPSTGKMVWTLYYGEVEV